MRVKVELFFKIKKGNLRFVYVISSQLVPASLLPFLKYWREGPKCFEIVSRISFEISSRGSGKPSVFILMINVKNVRFRFHFNKS